MIYRKQEKSKVKTAAKAAGKILIAIMIVIDLWFAVSVAEVTMKNIRPNPQYNECNLLYMAMQIKNK